MEFVSWTCGSWVNLVLKVRFNNILSCFDVKIHTLQWWPLWVWVVFLPRWLVLHLVLAYYQVRNAFFFFFLYSNDHLIFFFFF
jgi:hypothetical protein